MKDCSYSPQLTPGSAPAIPSSAPTIIVVPTVELTYPFISPTTTINLPSPAFGDSFSTDTRKIVRDTRGKTLRVLKAPTWPTIKTLTLNIVGICDPTEIKAFLKESIGKEIGYLDYESRQWRGVILNPEEPIKQIGRSNYSITLKFQGRLA